MKKNLLVAAVVCLCGAFSAYAAESPNGKLTVKTDGRQMIVCRDGKQALTLSDVPFKASGDASPLKFVRSEKVDYQMLAGKRLHCSNEVNVYEASLEQGQRLVLQLFNDGMAFRYEYDRLKKGAVPAESTTYLVPDGTRRWMQRWADSYEGFFPLTTSTQKGRYGYPALLEPADGLFVLLSEANIERRQSASFLEVDGEHFRVTPAENKVEVSGSWHTPWRVAIIGSLNDVVESTLITDVSNPCQLDDTSWIKPGVVSWVYWAYNHGSNDYQIIKKYVDMAVTLKLPYVLIDAEWDTMKDGKTIEDAVGYAKSKGVKPLIWYNSSVGWVDGAPTPKFRLNKPEDREREFAWCEQLGVAGVKIDFFSGDNQMNMDYCLDLMESAARHHLLVNFHGATIPRGWQRTYPNLLTTEGVYGAEWYNNVPTFTAKAAAHNATLPFTRNVIGPMDYTPCTFSDSQHPHITSNAHELALTVLYESGLQHLADKPESYFAQPREVQAFLSHLPVAWDETRFVAGYPGEFVVLARRSGNTWYVAGINGSDNARNIPLSLGGIVSERRFATAFFDNAFDKGKWDIHAMGGVLPQSVNCQPRGGFVFVINEDVHNPMLWSDTPDPDVIRVGDTFYLVTTTMHLMPGAPVMASKDLKNWETVSYIFDRLTDSPKYDLQEGTVYGRGQWATSLKYHNGKLYALLAPNEGGDMGKTYIFSAELTKDAQGQQQIGPWKLVSRMRHFHDCSLFFDDDNRVYVVYGTGEMMELKQDLSDVIEGSHRQLFQREADERGLLEGSRMLKHNGRYYLMMISHTYAPGRHRREVCYRSDNIRGPYEKQIILESDFGGFSYEAQGTIVDTEDGDWYGIIFQDRGGVGRVLTLMPCRWIDGWPMLGDENGKVPATVRPLKSGQKETTITKSDDFSADRLGLHWQWNHNPIDKAWSLTERKGFLRLKTSRVVSSLYLAPNTLTQRMEGPACSGAVCLDLSHMKDGDCAGLAAFNGDSGVLTVKKNGRKLSLSMTEQSVSLTDREKQVTDVKLKEVETVALTSDKLWLRVDADFQPNGRGGGRDLATFYYSLDGSRWTKIGSDYRMVFDYRRFFMGTKFGIFCYATKKQGGYVDVDQFVYNKIEQ